MKISPIEVELIRNGFKGICLEMFVAIMKSAYSTNIKERRDHSTAIFDAGGRIVAQGESLPLHLASMTGLAQIVLARYGREAIRPGDIFISNDPFVGRGSHLPDVAMLAPVFHDGEICLFVGNIAHHADIGGMVPGSQAGGMTEIFQEGLRIPPIRLASGGVLNEEMLELILLNVRIPEERRGDYAAQIAGCRLGVRRLEALLDRWTAERVLLACQELIAAGERRMRAAIRALPDGTYAFADVMDDDGMGTSDIAVKVKVDIRGDEIWFDFSGSAPQVRGNINNSLAGLEASVLYALKALVDPEGDANHGMFMPIHITAPEASVVNASFPAATAQRGQTCQRIIDVVIGALSVATPERAIAASNGAVAGATFAGMHHDGRRYVYMETIGGGGGARAFKDGTDGVQVHITNTSNLPIEALEWEYPILIEAYEFIEGSGGQGRHRGGLGLRRSYRTIAGPTTFIGQNERAVHAPWGLRGGEPGRRSAIRILHGDGTEEALTSKPAPVEVDDSDLIIIETPGGGGYGPPAERSVDDIERDVLREKCRAGAR